MISEQEIDCEAYHCKFWGGMDKTKCRLGLKPDRNKATCQRYGPYNDPSKFDRLQLDLRTAE